MVEELVQDAAKQSEKTRVRALIIVDHELRTKQGGRTFILHEQPEKVDGKTIRSITVICGEQDAKGFAEGMRGDDVRVLDYDLWKDMKGPVDYFK
jgi:hypothetical protein